MAYTFIGVILYLNQEQTKKYLVTYLSVLLIQTNINGNIKLGPVQEMCLTSKKHRNSQSCTFKPLTHLTVSVKNVF